MIRENMPCHAATSPIPWGVFKPKASPTEHTSAENAVNVDLSTVLQKQSQSLYSYLVIMKRMATGVKLPRFKSRLHLLMAIRFWASDIAKPQLSHL